MYWDTVVQVSGTNFTTTSLTLVDITGLTFAATANKLYELEIVLKVQSSTSGGMQFSVAFSAAGATGEYVHIGSASQQTTGVGADANQLGVANQNNKATSANTDAVQVIKAVVTIGANAGNITAQVQKSTSGTATVYIGSVMKIKALA